MQRLDELARHPLRYPPADFVRAGYRRSVYGSHSIDYRVVDDTVLIMRVLGREDANGSLQS